MKTKLYKYLIISLVAVFAIAGFTSCGDDVTEQYYVGSDMYTTSFTVNSNEWTWNEVDNRYEYFRDITQLDEYVYKYGGINVYAFLNPGEANETQVPIQDEFTHKIDNGDGTYNTYDERITCDFVVGQVGLYIQSSDLYRDDNLLPNKIGFKVVLTWLEN